MLNKLTVAAIAAINFAVCAHAVDFSNSELVSKLQETGDQLTSIVNSVENEFTAQQVLPQVEKLSAEFRRLRAEFANRREADPTNVIRFGTDVAVTMNKLKKALIEFNANEDIPFGLRTKITKLININLKADYS